MTEIGTTASFEPSRMMEPLPNCFSICASARSSALLRSSAIELLWDFWDGCCGGLYNATEANKKRNRHARTRMCGNCPESGSQLLLSSVVDVLGPALGRNVVSAAGVFLLRMHRTLRMVGGLLGSQHSGSFKRLVRVG